jgi:hypothetical protein
MLAFRTLLVLLSWSFASSFRIPARANKSPPKMSNNDENIAAGLVHPFCLLPGDPSLLLTTNVDLGEKKMDIMKACSKAIVSATGKPESYVGT